MVVGGDTHAGGNVRSELKKKKNIYMLHHLFLLFINAEQKL